MRTVPGIYDQWKMETAGHRIRYDLTKMVDIPLSLTDILALEGDPDDQLRQIANEPNKYGPFTGPVGMREEIAKLYDDCDILNILPTHGAISANDIVLRYLYEEGDNCVYLTPTFPQLIEVAVYEGYEIRYVPFEGNESTAQFVEALGNAVDTKTKVIVLTNPIYPTGRVLTKDILERIMEVAQSVDAYVLCDEVFRFHDFGKPVPSVFGMYEKAVAVGNITKLIGAPGIRVGWVVSSKKNIEDFTLLSQYHGRLCAFLDQKAIHIAIRHYNEFHNHNLQRANYQLAIFKDWLNKEPSVRCQVPEAGMTALIELSDYTDSRLFCENLLRDKGVLITPGEPIGCKGSFFISLYHQKLRDALDSISELLHES